MPPVGMPKFAPQGLALADACNSRHHEGPHGCCGQRIHANDLPRLRCAVGLRTDITQKFWQHEEAPGEDHAGEQANENG